MSYPDLQGQIQVIQAIAAEAQAADADINSSDAAELNGGIDCLGFRYALVIVNYGTTNANGVTVKVQETSNSDGSTGVADITGATFGSATASGRLLYGVIDTSATARYLNVNLLNGATNPTDISVDVLLWASEDTRNYAPTATTFAVGGTYDA